MTWLFPITPRHPPYRKPDSRQGETQPTADLSLRPRRRHAKRRLSRLARRTTRLLRKLRSRWSAGFPVATLAHATGDVVFAGVGYRLWWYLRSPFAPARSDCRTIVVVGGAARSGTTLLRTMLGRHPLIAAERETTVFLHRISSPQTLGDRLGWDPLQIMQWQRDSRSQIEFIERFQQAVLARSNKSLWVEKTPKNVQRFGFVRRRFPHVKLVHIIRDGRDVVCSLRRKPFAKLGPIPWDGVEAARQCARQWTASVTAGLKFRDDPAYHELRYEDLVRHPEPTLRALVDFLGVPWDDRLLEPAPSRPAAGGAATRDADEAAAAGPIFGSSIGRWRAELSDAARRELDATIGPLLQELGYEADRNGYGAPQSGGHG